MMTRVWSLQSISYSGKSCEFAIKRDRCPDCRFAELESSATVRSLDCSGSCLGFEQMILHWTMLSKFAVARKGGSCCHWAKERWLLATAQIE